MSRRVTTFDDFLFSQNTLLYSLSALPSGISNHDSLRISIPRRFQCVCSSSCTQPSFLLVHLILSYCFVAFSFYNCCCHKMIQYHHRPRKVAWRLHILSFMSDCAVCASCQLYPLISLLSIRSVAFFLDSTIAPSVFFSCLEMSRPRIHTSGWAQYSTPGLLPLCG